MMIRDIFFERRRSFIFSALRLNGNDLSTVLQDKIDLAVFIREVPGLNVELAAQLLQYIVFGQGTLELIIGFQKNCAVIYTSHVLKKTGIKNKEFELIQLVKA